jgi:SNF2 family DNA or RNA helicase
VRDQAPQSKALFPNRAIFSSAWDEYDFMQTEPDTAGSVKREQPQTSTPSPANASHPQPSSQNRQNESHLTPQPKNEGVSSVESDFAGRDPATDQSSGLLKSTGNLRATLNWPRQPLQSEQLHALLSLAAVVRAVPKPPGTIGTDANVVFREDDSASILQSHKPYQTVLRLLAAQVCARRQGMFTFPQLKALRLQLQAYRFLRLADAAGREALKAGRHPRTIFRRTGSVLPAVLRRAMTTGLMSARLPDGTRLPCIDECLQVMTEVEQQCQQDFPQWEALYEAEAALVASETQYSERVRAHCAAERWLPVGKVVTPQGVELTRPLPLDPVLLCRERDREIRRRVLEARRALEAAAQSLERTFQAAYTEDSTPIPDALVLAYLRVRSRQAMLRLLRYQQQVRERVLEAAADARAPNPANGGRISNKRIRIELSRQEREEKRAREAEEREQRRQTLTLWRALEEYATTFRAFFRDERSRTRQRMNREIHRFFEEREKSDQRREREEERRRIQALRENNEEAYRALVQNTKNERLKLILNQTDEYLRQLGAIVRENRDDEYSSRPQTTLDENAIPVSGQLASDSYYELVHRVREPVQQQSSLLTGGELKHYQLVGVEWLLSLYNNRLNGVLADEMGLGKTVQTIALLCHLIEFKQDEGPFLIVVPLSTLSNWESELLHWAPSLKVSVFKGDKNARRRLANELFVRDGAGRYPFHVLLTTYEYALRARAALSKNVWSYIIVDEGHRIKNAASKLAQVLGQRYRSRNRLLLTGTPLHNSLAELWSLLNFLLPHIFSSCDTFEAWFNAPFATMPGEQVELTEEESLLIINRLHKVLRPFLLRRLKNEILRGGEKLPEKREVMFLCDMSAWQRLVYKQLLCQERVAFIDRSGRHRFDRLSNSKMQMRKIVNHPFLFHTEYEPHDVDELVRASGKFQILDACLQKLLRTGHRVLVFNQMTRIMDLQERLLRARGIPFLRLQGLTTADERRQMVYEFNRPGTIYNVFLLTTRAGGLGVNLQTADTVILFDSDWNPQMDIQAQDRAHRIGQKKAVRVLRIVTARSVEQHVLEKAGLKLDMVQKIIRAGMFHQEAKDSEREAFLRHLLRESAMNETEEVEEALAPTAEGHRPGIHSLAEINRLLARSDAEYELFCAMDRAYLARLRGIPPEDPSLQDLSEQYPPLLDDHEIPAFIREPERHGYRRGRDDTASLWTHGALEDEGELYPRRRKRRSSASKPSLDAGHVSTVSIANRRKARKQRPIWTSDEPVPIPKENETTEPEGEEDGDGDARSASLDSGMDDDWCASLESTASTSSASLFLD